MSSSIKLQALTFEHALEDVESRFLYNLPVEDLQSTDRLVRIEQAWWFYEDFMADKYEHLPHFKSIKSFAAKMFDHCPLLSKSQDRFHELFDDFSSYKKMIPVFGCIMLNSSMTKMVMVNSWSGKSWSFPKGKVNQNEQPLACAIRETLEETGFDCSVHVRREEDNVQCILDDKLCKLYIAVDVPEDTYFMPQTRKEISKVEFHRLDNLPGTTFGVTPFLPKLRRFIQIHKKGVAPTKGGSKDKDRAGSGGNNVSSAASKKLKSSKSDSDAPSSKTRSAQSAFDVRNGETFEAGEGSKRWDVNAMFAANAQLTGRKYDYDGNPHNFGAEHPRYNSSSAAQASVAASSSSHLASNILLQQLAIASQQFRVEFPSFLSHVKIQKGKAATVKSSGDSTDLSAHNGNSYVVASGGESSSTRTPSVNWTSAKRLPERFVLNKSLILGAVDDMLSETTESRGRDIDSGFVEIC